MPPPLLVLAEPAHPGGPVHDVALPTVVLRLGLPDGDEVLRVYSPDPTAAFTRRDSRSPGYDAAVALARASGFAPVVRPQGGRVAAYHRGSVVIDHVQRTLCSHGQRIAQRRLAVGRADGGDHHFVGASCFLDAQRLFDRDLVEGIDAEFDAVEHHARAIRLDPDAHVVVDDTFDCDENPSGLSSHWLRV